MEFLEKPTQPGCFGNTISDGAILHLSTWVGDDVLTLGGPGYKVITEKHNISWGGLMCIAIELECIALSPIGWLYRVHRNNIICFFWLGRLTSYVSRQYGIIHISTYIAQGEPNPTKVIRPNRVVRLILTFFIQNMILGSHGKIKTKEKIPLK
jgi:hypothetical protein